MKNSSIVVLVLVFMFSASSGLQAAHRKLGDGNAESVQQQPSLPEVWRAPLAVGSEVMMGEGSDEEHLIVWGGALLASFRSSDGVREWEFKPQAGGVSFRDGTSFMMMRKSPAFVMSGFSSGFGGIGVIQFRSYPSGDTIRTIFASLSGGRPTVSDNERYVAGSLSQSSGVAVWDIETKEKIWSMPDTIAGHLSFATCWTRDSTRLLVTDVASSRECIITCWDIENNRKIWTQKKPGAVLFEGEMSGDGKRMIIGNGSIGSSTKLEVFEFPVLNIICSKYGVSSYGASSDGKFMAIGPRMDQGRPVQLNIAMLNVDQCTERMIDSNRYWIGTVTDRNIYAISQDYVLHKLQFDWVTSAPEQTKQPLRTFFPNPCTEQGWFEYDVLGTQDVSLDVYDTSGKHVRNVSHGVQSGLMKVPFTCTDLPAGAYVSVLRIGSNTYSQNMMLGVSRGVR